MVGALFHPPKSSSAAIVVSAGFVLFADEPQPLSIAFVVEVFDGAGADSGAPHTSDEPQASIPEKPDETTGGGG